jgi:hypothetical protein
VLCDVDEDTIKELAAILGMPKLKTASFVRSCAELRATWPEEMQQLKTRVKVLEMQQINHESR